MHFPSILVANEDEVKKRMIYNHNNIEMITL